MAIAWITQIIYKSIKRKLNNMKISIIVPVYNVEKYLERCLDSLINQTLKDIEIICINDGSTDNSSEILKEYAKKDSRIIIINQNNQGISVARNNGMNKAKGKYIGFVDSDDWVDLDFFEKLYKAAEKHNAQMAVCSIIRLNEYRNKKYLQLKNETVTDDFREKCVILDIPQKSYVWNKLYLKEALDKHQINFKQGVYYEDLYFVPVALEKLTKMVTVPDTFYYYWKNKDSIVFQKSEKHTKDYTEAKQYASEILKKHGLQVGENKIKFLGFTIFKEIKKINRIIYIFFNIIRFSKSI